jgi:hypothetical protein
MFCASSFTSIKCISPLTVATIIYVSLRNFAFVSSPSTLTSAINLNISSPSIVFAFGCTYQRISTPSRLADKIKFL